MSGRFGKDLINETVARYEQADGEAYASLLAEYGERMAFLESAADPERPTLVP
jgi:hypothetical protein